VGCRPGWPARSSGRRTAGSAALAWWTPTAERGSLAPQYPLAPRPAPGARPELARAGEERVLPLAASL
jgi:hypothetical protein